MPTLGSTLSTANISPQGTGIAEMYMYDNVTKCEIDTTNVYHAVFNSFGNNDGTLAPQLDTNEFTYKAGVKVAITAYADYNAPTSTQTECTTAGHTLLAGEPITITGTTNYNGTYLVLAAGLTATKFVITKAFAGDDATGNARRPATLKVLNAGIIRVAFAVSGSCDSANDVLKFEMNKDITPLDNVVCNAIWDTTTKYRTASTSGFVSVTAGQYLWLSVKNYSGTGDITIRAANVNVKR